MAASREASIHITMKNQGFLSGLRKMTSESKTQAKAMGATLKKSLSAGLKGGINEGKKALKELGSGIKDTVKHAATFGGALGGAAMVANAVQLQGAYSDVANMMERATGKTYSMVQAQKVIGASADATKRTHQEMTSALSVMLDRGSDPTDAVANLTLVGDTMNATGMDAERSGRLIAGLSSEYGLSGKQASGMIDSVVNAAAKSNVTMEEFMEDFIEFGSLAEHAGIRGEGGLRTMLGMFVKMGPQVNGTTSEISSGMEIMFEKMRDVAIMERVFKDSKSKMKFSKDDFKALDGAQEQMEFLAKAGPKAMKTFAEEFTGREEKAAFDAFFGPYFESLAAGMESGESELDAHTGAMLDTRMAQLDLMKDVGKQGLVAKQSSDVQKHAAAKMRDAMNKLSEAVTQPAMLSAIDTMAENLPTLAKAVADAMEFIVKNPYASGAMFVGGKVGLSIAQGALLKAGGTIGTAAATTIRTKAAAAGKWGVAGRALGVAAGAAIAFYIGKQLIDSMYADQGKQQSDVITSGLNASQVAKHGTTAEKTALLQQTRQKIKTERARAGSFSGKTADAANQTFGAISGTLGMTDGYTDTRADSLAKMQATERELEASLKSNAKNTMHNSDAADTSARALNNLAVATRGLGKAMKGASGDGGTVKPGHTGPGHLQQ